MDRNVFTTYVASRRNLYEDIENAREIVQESLSLTFSGGYGSIFCLRMIEKGLERGVLDGNAYASRSLPPTRALRQFAEGMTFPIAVITTSSPNLGAALLHFGYAKVPQSE